SGGQPPAAAPAAPAPAAAAAAPAAASARKMSLHVGLSEAEGELVSGPLVAVQTSLMKDTAVWTRGIYSTPLIIPAVLRCCLLLSDRLAALQLVVADTPPPVSGRLSGWAFAKSVLPLHREMTAMLEALDRLAAGTARLLDPLKPSAVARHEQQGQGQGLKGGEGDAAAAAAAAEAGGAAAGAAGGGGGEDGGDSYEGDVARLEAAVRELDERRLQIRQHIHDMRRAFHASVLALDEQQLPAATHPDDTTHVNATMYALVKVLDKATKTARTALEFRRGKEKRGSAWFAVSRG
ncbi:hypothetical protein Agub_g4559, partial [Astrephomene gubernaculifera]